MSTVLKIMKNYFTANLEKYTEKRSEDFSIVKVETILDIEKASAKTLSERKTKSPLFYEIPK